LKKKKKYTTRGKGGLKLNHLSIEGTSESRIGGDRTAANFAGSKKS